ncbi:Acyl-CoA-binding domain-containing protein 1 [Acorus gramineus]|uniref:Acyl-CoA-binding domain-containing protein 1 n=1 Tax=Acorus gramineus TaxID=55184 RepID=A0AAV9ABW5_ACOGR|nr:Acyl-CoA-binding domain-containing protein 1 [Acorus gramineus]
MELFQELLITAGLSLLVAIAIAKLLALISNGENPLDPTVLRTDRDASAPDRSGSEEDRRFGGERTVETEFEEEEEGHVEERLGTVEEEKEAEESFMSSLEVMISGRDDVREGLDEERGTDVEVNEKVEEETEIEEKVEEETEIEEKVEEETEIEEKVEKEMFDGEDEWEGIERSEWEERFRVAAAFVGAAENEALVSGLGNDLQMQLYGLHKVATEGTCYETQPLALKVAARAKWVESCYV